MSSKVKEKKTLDPSISAQSKTFLKWIAVITGKRVLKSDSLHEELSDGVLLIELIQSLVPYKRIRGR